MSRQSAPDVLGREVLDDPLLIELRTVLDEVESDLDGWPTTMPPWERISAGMKRSRRRRRVRLAGRVVVGAVAVTLVGAGVMTNVVPYPSFAPTFTLPVAGGESALYDQPVHGSLKADTAWLAAFRRHVADGEADRESGGEVWRPPAADDLRVLFAGDVGPYRLALVEGDWHWGPIASPQQVWYLGRAGATAKDLMKGGNSEPVDTPAEILRPGSLSDATGQEFVLVVLSPKPVQVRLQASPTIDAQARVVQHITPVEAAEPGVYTQVVTEPGSYQPLLGNDQVAYPFTVAEPGTDPNSTDPNSTDPNSTDPNSTDPNSTGPAPVDLTPVRGGADEAQDSMMGDEIRERVRQPGGSGRFRYLVGTSSTAGQNLAVHPHVGLVTLPGGARVLGLGGVLTRSADDASYATEFDAATLVPAGPVAELAVAWRSVDAEFHDRPTWTAAMGPVGTATVEWRHRDGTVTTSPARYTLAVTISADVTSVRFLDADGRQLATRPVLAPMPWGTPVPQVAVAELGPANSADR